MTREPLTSDNAAVTAFHAGSIPLLPWDILLSIVLFLRRDDQSRFIRTCWTLYKSGMHIFLQVAHFTRGQNAVLASFLNFVLQDPIRPGYLRSLGVTGHVLSLGGHWHSGDELEERILQPRLLLERVLSVAENIEQLYLSDIVTFFDNDQVYTALSLLRRLEIASFHDIGPKTCKLLSVMQSAITVVDLHCHAEYNSDVCDDFNFSILSKYHKSLRTVTFRNLCSPASVHLGLQFPRVQTLRIEGLKWDPPCLEGLIHTFPNLKQLTWDVGGQSQIARDQDVRTAHRRHWDLDKLTCCASWLCDLAWKGDVRLWDATVVYDQESVQEFRLILGELKPQHLSVGLELFNSSLFDIPLFLHKLANLTHLRLCVYGDQIDDNVNSKLLGRMAVYVATTLQKLPSAVFVAIHFTYDTSTVHTCPAKCSSFSSTMRSAVECIADMHSVLEHVHIATNHMEMELGERLWRIVRRKLASDYIEELSGSAAEMVLSKSPFGTMGFQN